MMRGKDYRRLARLSLMAKRKTTIQTVIGISFGLVLLFPLLFIAIGFYGGFTAHINEEPMYRAMRVNYADRKTESGEVFCEETYEKEIDKISGIKNNLKFEHYYFYNRYGNKCATFSIDGGEKINILSYPGRTAKSRFLGMEVFDDECAQDPFIDADYRQTAKPLVVGTTFSKDNSKGEIMVSTNFAYDHNFEPEELVGSTISFYNHVYPTLINYSSSMEEAISPAEYKADITVQYFNEYKIVGVFSSKIYHPHNPRYRSTQYNLTSSYSREVYGKEYFWITHSSLCEDKEIMAPKRVTKTLEDTNKTWYYYEDTPKNLSEKITNEGYVFLPVGLGAFSKVGYYPTYTKTQLLEFTSFQKAKYGYDDIIDCYHRSVTGDPDSITYSYEGIAPEGFFVYQSFFDRFLFLCIGFGVFGGVIFLATLLNLINTLHYSVESMKGFLGICRANGLKKRGVVRIFFSQINIIFARGYISTVIIGGGACVAIKLIFDRVLRQQIMDDSNMDLTIDWWYIPIALGILLVLTTTISVVISNLLVKKVNKTPVLEILSEENRM